MCRGTLLGIAIRSKSRAAMTPLPTIMVSVEAGCEGDFRGKPGPRQVTILSRESWDQACESMAQKLDWTDRRANLFVAGIEFSDSTDDTIEIGDLVLQVTGETDPCGRMDEISPGLCDALRPNWRGGVCCRVIRGGQISIGDAVTRTPSEARSRSDPT